MEQESPPKTGTKRPSKGAAAAQQCMRCGRIPADQIFFREEKAKVSLMICSVCRLFERRLRELWVLFASAMLWDPEPNHCA